MPTVEEIRDWQGQDIHNQDGDKLGSVGEVYLDQQTGAPEWVAVKTGLFGTKLSFAPLAEARREQDGIVLPYSKEQIKDAPQVEADGELSQQEEAALYRHYGLSYDESRSDTGLADPDSTGTAGTTGTTGTTGDVDRDASGDSGRGTVGRDTSGPETDDAMTRSEEELRVGTTQRETGRARLRKYVVTEDVQTTVPVSHEEVRIEREPITDANRGDAVSGGDITEEEHEVTLHAEEPVVEKQVVAKERVRLDKETVTEEAQIDESVRKEQIDTDGAEGGRR